MIARLRLQVDEPTLPVVLGDMAATTVPGKFALVYLVSDLRTQAEQVACFRNAARHLRSGGRLVIELWMPLPHRLVPGNDAVAMEVRHGFAAFDDVATQACSSQSFRHDADGMVGITSGASATSGFLSATSWRNWQDSTWRKRTRTGAALPSRRPTVSTYLYGGRLSPEQEGRVPRAAALTAARATPGTPAGCRAGRWRRSAGGPGSCRLTRQADAAQRRSPGLLIDCRPLTLPR